MGPGSDLSGKLALLLACGLSAGPQFLVASECCPGVWQNGRGLGGAVSSGQLPIAHLTEAASETGGEEHLHRVFERGGALCPSGSS